MNNWDDDVNDSAGLADEMSIKVKAALSNPNLMASEARTLLNEINEFYFNAGHILQSAEDAGADADTVDYVESIVEIWASMSAALTNWLDQLRNH